MIACKAAGILAASSLLVGRCIAVQAGETERVDRLGYCVAERATAFGHSQGCGRLGSGGFTSDVTDLLEGGAGRLLSEVELLYGRE